MTASIDSTSAEAVRGRLNILTENHAQAEIARRTGFPPANVHRFLKGGKIPADFCGAVVREFGINPAWLLTGEGAPRLSDVTEGTMRMAGNVLELVEAMSAVARMRLGSLTGKHHLRVLRELNDALEDHERLRERLNEHSHPVFQKLVEDIRATMEKRDLERATDLIKAAEQVQRLCADDKLSLELDAHHAHLAFLMRDFETSADYRRRVFIRQLAGSIEFSELRLLILYSENHRNDSVDLGYRMLFRRSIAVASSSASSLLVALQRHIREVLSICPCLCRVASSRVTGLFVAQLILS